MKLILIYFTILTQTFVSVIVCDEGNSDENRGSKLLSRRKRFLIFPDGSSLQLVFCVQTAALIPIGDIFLFGNTAALAWNLPTDPKLLYMLKGYDKEALRRGDVANSIHYVDENGKLLAKVPYKRKPIVNPAFAKRSVDGQETFKQKLKEKIDRMKMHEVQKNRYYLKKDHMDPHTIEFHRNSRLELFEKIERLITATGQDGRQCVLFKLCEAAQHADQGSFLEEFLRVVFTLPKGVPFDKEEHREYDKAHTTHDEECSKRYPGCDNFEIHL